VEHEKGRAADEIEVTPEMIEAGLTEFLHYDFGEDNPDYAGDIVRAIFTAMVLCRDAQHTSAGREVVSCK
jgi:hypothetical protein